MLSLSFNSKTKRNRGFTIIELMVTVGIFVFMTALILSRYTGYSSGTLLTNLAYDVALSIRHAQTFGLSVVQNDSANFSSAYGIYFDKTDGNNTKYVLFSDGDAINSPDQTFTEGTLGDKAISTYNFKQGAKISNICVSLSAQTCDSPAISPDYLFVTFLRPEPAANICDYDRCYEYAEITISSRDGATRVVSVNRVGQIQVKN